MLSAESSVLSPQSSVLSPASRVWAAVAEKLGEVKGVDDAITAEVGRAAGARPPGSDQLRQIECVRGAVSV